ncbi:MAG TPA: transcriptional repressor [Myxococcales bacterium]|nr:transcriptional repressor [Myxococcales bacterium]
MRMTPQRLAIFRYLEGNSGHPTAEDVYRAVRRKYPGLSLATVYNTLETLSRLGEVARHDLGGGAERWDPEVRPHHHFTCEGCGGVRDVFAELRLPEFEGLGAATVHRAQLQLSGLCEACQSTVKHRSARRGPQ